MREADVIYLFIAYLLPILFFVYTATDVLVRNAKKVEHKLLFLTAVVYILLFTEEFVRHLLPISYSPALVALWFSNVGIIMPGLGFHFLAKFSGVDKLMPRYLYPGIFYLPLSVIIVNLLSSHKVISSSAFTQDGIWKYPVYNAPYYAALTISILISCLYLVVLYIGKRKAQSKEHKDIFRLLVFGVVLCTCWHVAFGYFQYSGVLPPYSYIYGGVIWCFVLRLAMLRFDFLNFKHKRYEKLFHLNPAAILLVEPNGRIKEFNPSARQLFEGIDLKLTSFYSLSDEGLRHKLELKKDFKSYEMAIRIGRTKLDVLIDGGFVFVDNESHMIVIVRDVTEQKESQEAIRFLAYHDPLTRLPNRRYFYESFHEALHEAETAEPDNLNLTVILIDLDDFKQTNDRYGHEAGDEVLRHISRMIGEAAALDGMAARLGGDEFVLFLRHAPSTEYAKKIVDRLRRRVAEDPPVYKGQPISSGLSIGMSVFPDDGVTASALLMSADKAMYRVKRSNKRKAVQEEGHHVI
ncbi:GGDEF domain-containing protein [Paenibacillus sp. strain BS8-2]